MPNTVADGAGYTIPDDAVARARELMTAEARATLEASKWDQAEAIHNDMMFLAFGYETAESLVERQLPEGGTRQGWKDYASALEQALPELPAP